MKYLKKNLSATLTCWCFMNVAFASDADLRKGLKVVYERNIIDFKQGVGERAIVTYEILDIDFQNKTLKLRKETVSIGGQTVIEIYLEDMNRVVTANQAQAVLDSCGSSNLENVWTEMGRVLSCRTAKNEDSNSLFFYANVPFGFTYKVDYDQEQDVTVKYMLLRYR